MATVRKAVIPAAGLGTRFLPATKAQPKEMLPLVDKPAIQFVVEEAVRAGIRDILIITGRSKRSIEDHFDRTFELEHYLEAGGKLAELEEMRNIAEMADIHYVRQGEPLGLGHAVSVAREHVGDASFAVLLADDIMHSSSKVLEGMIETHDTYGRSVVAVKEVAPHETSLYGCVDPEPVAPGLVKVVGIVEKPSPEEAPSNLAVMGRYVFTPEIFTALEQVKPGKGGEIQLTDAIAILNQEQDVYGYVFDKGRYDVGNKQDYLRATVELALERPDLGPAFRDFLVDLVKREGSCLNLIDPFNRTVRDLRISVTDRCDFRCRYCMPEEGLQWLPRDEILTFEEIARVARICVARYEFDAIRLTGGEPTLRRGIVDLVAMLAPLGVDLAMTTNGASLERLAEPLRVAGLTRINISCDSLRADRFADLTRRDALDKVLAGIDAALVAGFNPVKVNAVLMRGVNDDEAVDFARFGREKGVQIRFIEFMPLDAEGGWSRDQVVSAEETVAAINAVYPLEGFAHAIEPATRYRYADGRGEIGVVPSVTQPFCGDCDRIRLTADGQLRSCLFALDEHDVRAVLRNGGTDDDVAAVIERGVGAKWAGHRIGQVTFIRPSRSMSQIGG